MAKQWMKMAVLAGVLALSRLCMAADVSGKWIAASGGTAPQYAHVTLTIDGARITGTWGISKIDGTLTDGKLDIKLTDEQGNSAGALTGTLTGDTITVTGTASSGGAGGRGGGFGGGGGGGRGGAAGPVTYILTRPAVPPATPRSINFSPTDDQIFSFYSGANKPAIHIFPGDVVHTWTPDAGGVDAKGVQHRGGDSNIGPFYVEGALPGDTLVLHLLKVRTNRSTAHQGSHINAHAITTAYLTAAKYDPGVTGEWTLLPEKGIAVPTHPSEHMKNYSIPLKPMLGCISVAPQGDQQYRGGDLGPFGGNLDYIGNGEGATLYFPVSHAGALLGMGDGHAAMGEGEVVGSGLETSMDVDFSVEVIPSYSSGMVRSENKDYLMAFGVAGSVPVSIQVATTALATWIKKDYNLSDSEVAILFASELKYDIAELVDSRYDVVAKIPKSVLATIK